MITLHKHRRLAVTVLLAIMGGTVAATTLVLETTGTEPDGSSSDLLLLYVALALVFSFLCSVAEAVLLSITPSYIANLQMQDPAKGELLKRLKQQNVDRSLAAILTLNTIAHTVGAIGSGSKATAVFGSAWFGLFSAVMTLMILFFSEIIPKTLGAVYWRRLVGITAQFIRLLIILLYPLILISEQLTRLVAHGRPVHGFNRDEFVAMADVGAQSGHIQEQESRIIRNLFRFDALTAKDVMTPSTVVVAFDQETSIAQVLASKQIAPFTRLPVYHDSLDQLTGFVLKGDLLLAQAEQRGDQPISQLRRDIVTVVREMPLSQLLEFLLDKRQHIAQVSGKYGETDGVVTLEDVIETLLGMEILDEHDKVADLQALARQQWASRAKALGLELERQLQQPPADDAADN